ncbi:hypothetical protein [Streptomyces cavernicola]|uniref:Integral membrane protein n=1 Tax=Streptomyces cavernicola TaxID=3043613 RepID=A0ABT6S3L5_9ACTN|nr:hypothetical protein [Streptomyces sp. B-S-A6]MDI3402689.1 hypothetical protein [Streptomyces sp. B-S-A6]
MAAPLPRPLRAARETRETRTGVSLRALRAAVFAAVCVALSAGGHALASCASVPLWSLAVGFLAVLAVALPLAGRPRSTPGIAASLTLGQLGLHALFGIGQQGAHVLPGSADSALIARAARLVCGAGAAAISPAEARRILSSAGIDPDSAVAAHQHGEAAVPGQGMAVGLAPDVPMLLGHLLAGLAAGWLLRRGDLALLRLFELSAYAAHGIEEGVLVRPLRAAVALALLLRAGLRTLLGRVPCAARTARWVLWQPRTAVLDDTVTRRGPPADAFALAA